LSQILQGLLSIHRNLQSDIQLRVPQSLFDEPDVAGIIFDYEY